MIETPGGPITTYMITSGGPEERVLEALARGLKHGVDLFQIRRPGTTGRGLEAFVENCLELDPGARDRWLVNDRLDVALATGIGGVHLKAAGLPVAAVRRRAPGGFRIGVSTHDLDEVRQAARDGASFVVFGPVFPTTSKPGHPGVGLDALREAARASTVPVFALGGVGPDNVAEVAAAGASGVAGISAFEDEALLTSLLAELAGRTLP